MICILSTRISIRILIYHFAIIYENFWNPIHPCDHDDSLHKIVFGAPLDAEDVPGPSDLVVSHGPEALEKWAAAASKTFASVAKLSACMGAPLGGSPGLQVRHMSLIVGVGEGGARKAMFVHWANPVTAMQGREVRLDFDVDPPGIIYLITTRKAVCYDGAAVIVPDLGVCVGKVGGHSKVAKAARPRMPNEWIHLRNMWNAVMAVQDSIENAIGDFCELCMKVDNVRQCPSCFLSWHNSCASALLGAAEGVLCRQEFRALLPAELLHSLCPLCHAYMANV